MPERLLSQLAHVESSTPTPDASLRFYRDVLGLECSGSAGQSAFLRGWGDFFHHTLQLTEGEAPGLGHVAWRADRPEQLQAAVHAHRGDGARRGWYDDSVGHGPAYRYRSPGGHLHEVFWEVDPLRATAGLASPFPNRPQRYVPRGAALRCIDHVTIAAADPEGDISWYRDTLGTGTWSTPSFPTGPTSSSSA